MITLKIYGDGHPGHRFHIIPYSRLLERQNIPRKAHQSGLCGGAAWSGTGCSLFMNCSKEPRYLIVILLPSSATLCSRTTIPFFTSYKPAEILPGFQPQLLHELSASILGFDKQHNNPPVILPCFKPREIHLACYPALYLAWQKIRIIAFFSVRRCRFNSDFID